MEAGRFNFSNVKAYNSSGDHQQSQEFYNVGSRLSTANMEEARYDDVTGAPLNEAARELLRKGKETHDVPKTATEKVQTLGKRCLPLHYLLWLTLSLFIGPRAVG